MLDGISFEKLFFANNMHSPSYFSFRVFLVIIVSFAAKSANAYVYPAMDMGGSDSLNGFGASGGNAHLGDPDNPWGTGMTANDWFMLGGRSQPPQCVTIPKNLTLCNNIRYDKMRLPNLLDHDTLHEVVDQAASWVGLVSIKCHPDSQLFLCSLFSPVCLDRLIYPCRSICTAVKAGCEKRMLAYGFAWPEMLNCDKFPLDNDLCIKPQAHMQPVDNSCDACQQSTTFEGIMDNFCRAGLVVRAKVSEKKRRGDGSLELVLSKSKIYKYGNEGGRRSGRRRDRSSPSNKEPLHIFLENGNTCGCPVISTMTKKDSFLIMANRLEDRWVVSFIMKKPKKSKDFRRAVKKFSDNPCSKAVEFMTSETQKMIGGVSVGGKGGKDAAGSTKSSKSKNGEGRQTRNQRNSRKRQRQSQLQRRLSQRGQKRRQQQTPTEASRL